MKKKICSVAVAVALAGAASMNVGNVSVHAAHAAVGANARSAVVAAQYGGAMIAPLTRLPLSFVTGMAAMVAQGGQTTFAVSLAGFTPLTFHTVDIDGGACGSGAPARFRYSVESDYQGEVHLLRTLPLSGIPFGYSVTAHNTLVKLGTTRPAVLACGNVATPRRIVQLASANGSTTSAVGMIFEPAPVMGNAVKTGTNVIVYAVGMQPNRAQPLHIHAGPCGSPAPIMYALSDLVADAQGRGVSGGAVTDIVPLMGLSLHIHNTSWMMTACGNI